MHTNLHHGTAALAHGFLYLLPSRSEMSPRFFWVRAAGSVPTTTQLDWVMSRKNGEWFFRGGVDNTSCWQFCALVKYITSLQLQLLKRASRMPREGRGFLQYICIYISCNWKRFNLQRLRWTLEQKFHKDDIYEITESNLRNCAS